MHHATLKIDYTLPRLIALCGNPLAGKTTVQNILNQVGYKPIDDGYVLREFAVQRLGLTWDQVQTQSGKKEVTEILGKSWVHRDLLGTLGKQLEDMFGEWIMPFIATRGLQGDKRYSFGSARKTQGHFFRQMGAIVVEVQNPLALPSPYAFDQFDRSAVTHTLLNDGLARGMSPDQALFDLTAKVGKLLGEVSAAVK